MFLRVWKGSRGDCLHKIVATQVSVTDCKVRDQPLSLSSHVICKTSVLLKER